MAAPLNQIVQPFQNESVEPTRYDVPGQKGTPPVVVHIGLKGGTKTFSWSASTSASFYSPKHHAENAPRSASLQTALGTAADNVRTKTPPGPQLKSQLDSDAGQIASQSVAAGGGQS